MELRDPYLLLLLLPAGLAVLLAARRSGLGLPRWRLGLWIALRLLLVLCLVGVIAEARAVLPSRERAVVFALDVSESISAARRQHLQEWVRRAWAAHRPGDRAALIAFGTNARVEHPLSEAFEPGELQLEGIARDGTSIDQALRTAGGILRAEPGERLVVLLSDGNSAADRAETEAMALASAGIRVTTVAVELTPSPREVLVEDVSAPQVVSLGEPFLIKVQLRARSGGPATLHLGRHGGRQREQAVDLQPGINLVTLQERLEEPGTSLYEVTVAAELDADTLNNSGGAIVRARGPARVLFVQGPSRDAEGKELASFEEVAGPLQRALVRAGLEVRVGGPSSIPAGVEELQDLSALIVGDVGAERWSEAQMEAVRRWVHDQGGGLVALGGGEAFGLGGYWKTPFEAALPVSSDLRGKKVLPSLALVLCIDRSGSMLEAVGGSGANRLDLAKEGAVRALELLQPQDWLGVVAFDTSPEWIVPLEPVLDRVAATKRVRELESGGGTAISPSLREAHTALASAEAKLRHTVLFPDGKSAEDPLELTALERDFKQDRITLTTVGVGDEIDKELLRRLAERTGGRHLQVSDARTLPRLLAKEAVSASKALAIEREVAVRPVGDLGVALEWGKAPPLRGFVMTVARPEAEVLLDSGPGDGPQDGPILVRWRYGLGKSAAFTSDAAGRWSAPWLGWEGFGPLFASVVRWVAREAEAPGVETALALEDGRARVQLRATDPDGGPRNGLILRARLTGPPGSKELDPRPLAQTGPGEYEAEFEAARPGAWFATVEEVAERGAGKPVGSAGAVLAYPREYRDLTHDAALLASLAAKSRGGEALTVDDDPTRVFGGERLGTFRQRPLGPWLLLAAAVLLLLDLCARRLVLPEAARRLFARLRSKGRAAEVEAGGADLLDRLRAHKELQVSGRGRRREAAAAAASARELEPVTATLEPPPEPEPPKPVVPAPPPTPKPVAPPPPTPKVEEKDEGGMAKLLRAKREARSGGQPRGDSERGPKA